MDAAEPLPGAAACANNSRRWLAFQLAERSATCWWPAEATGGEAIRGLVVDVRKLQHVSLLLHVHALGFLTTSGRFTPHTDMQGYCVALRSGELRQRIWGSADPAFAVPLPQHEADCKQWGDEAACERALDAWARRDAVEEALARHTLAAGRFCALLDNRADPDQVERAVAQHRVRVFERGGRPYFALAEAARAAAVLSRAFARRPPPDPREWEAAVAAFSRDARAAGLAARAVDDLAAALAKLGAAGGAGRLVASDEAGAWVEECFTGAVVVRSSHALGAVEAAALLAKQPRPVLFVGRGGNERFLNVPTAPGLDAWTCRARVPADVRPLKGGLQLPLDYDFAARCHRRRRHVLWDADPKAAPPAVAARLAVSFVNGGMNPGFASARCRGLAAARAVERPVRGWPYLWRASGRAFRVTAVDAGSVLTTDGEAVPLIDFWARARPADMVAVDADVVVYFATHDTKERHLRAAYDAARGALVVIGLGEESVRCALDRDGDDGGEDGEDGEDGEW